MSQLWLVMDKDKYVERLFRRYHIPEKETKIQIFPFLTLDIDTVIPGTATAILQPGGKSQENHREVDSGALA